MDKTDLVVAVDVGTSTTKAVLVNPQGPVESTSQQYTVDVPRPGWCDQDPHLLSDAIISTVKQLLGKAPTSVENIRALTFTSQMSGLLPLDEDGSLLCPVLTWADTRAAVLTKKMIKGWPMYKGYFSFRKLLKFLKITGGAPNVSGRDTISKIYWLKHERPEIYAKTYKFVDNKDYAIFLATGKYVTSVDMAYITWLMDTREGRFQWSPEIFKDYDLDITKMCEIRPSLVNLGPITPEFANLTGLREGTPVINGAGDLLTSAIGSGAVETGKLHANVGTAGWVGGHFPTVVKNLVHYIGSIASGIPGMYLVLCKPETTGASLEWIKDLLYPKDLVGEERYARIFPEIDDLVKDIEAGSGNLIFTPYLFGERSPIQSSTLKATLFNLGMNHNRGHVLRAVYEGVAYNLRWGMEIVEELTKLPQTEVRLIGGGSKSDTWCQIFADVWQKKVVKMKNPQLASAVGAACIAFVSLGVFKDFTQIANLVQVEKEFIPDPAKAAIYDKLYAEFPKLYENNKKIFERLNTTRNNESERRSVKGTREG
jgi:xylulokinase